MLALLGCPRLHCLRRPHIVVDPETRLPTNRKCTNHRRAVGVRSTVWAVLWESVDGTRYPGQPCTSRAAAERIAATVAATGLRPRPVGVVGAVLVWLPAGEVAA